jgi:hypothetical protein
MNFTDGDDVKTYVILKYHRMRSALHLLRRKLTEDFANLEVPKHCPLFLLVR